MAKKSFKCSKCDKAFSMAAHLGRHMATIHASPVQKAVAKQKRKAKKGKQAGIAKGAKARKAKPIGRPKGVATRFGLTAMRIDQLAELIQAAQAETRRRIAQIQEWVQ
jgi:hypothetical protein